MATFNLATNPALVTSPNTSEHEAVFDPSKFKEYPRRVNVLVTTGTVSFNTAGVAANGTSLTTTNAVATFTLEPTMGLKLFFKANASNDAFKIWF